MTSRYTQLSTRRGWLICLAFVLALIGQPATAQVTTSGQGQTANVSGTVVNSSGTPVAGAAVTLIGAYNFTTTSNAQGLFTFANVPYGIYRIDVVARSLGGASKSNITVNRDINVAIQYTTVSNLKVIGQVSTNAIGAHINITPANITSINPSTYAFSGNYQWRDLLAQIPGVAVSGAEGGGGEFMTTIPGQPQNPVVLSINGALPYETALLLDGLPIINTSVATTGSSIYEGSGSDLSNLPLDAFDTADVVRGPGADSPSIVDSIGGSFVLHSPERVEQNSFEFSASNDPYGGLFTNSRAQFRFGRFSAVLAYGTDWSPGPLGMRDIHPLSVESPVTVNGQSFDSCYPQLLYGCYNYVPTPHDVISQCYCVVQSAFEYCCVHDNTEWSQHTGAVDLSYDIGPSITATIFYAGESQMSELNSSAQNSVFTPPVGYTGSFPAGGSQLIGFYGPWTYPQQSSLLEEKVTANVGSGLFRVAALQDNTYAPFHLWDLEPGGQYALYGGACIGPAPASSTCPSGGSPVIYNGASAALAFTPYREAWDHWDNNRDLLFSYELPIGSSFTTGISYVTSYYNDAGGYSYVYAGFPAANYTPPSTAETTDEVRLHVGGDVSDKLSLDFSWYFATGSYHVPNPANYNPAVPPSSWVDSVFPYNAPRFGAVWRASQDIAIRASAGGGFALPPIQDLIGTNGVPLCSVGTCSVTLTNLNLHPEESFGLDVGTDMRFHHDTVLSFDLYRTNLWGQFYTETNLTGFYLGQPLYTTEYDNLQQSRLEGMTLDLHHDLPRGLYWRLAFGLTRGYVVSVPMGFYNEPPVCNKCQNLYVIPGPNFNGYFASPVPYSNGTALLGYRWKPGTYIDLAPTYYGNDNAYMEPAFVELSAHAGYVVTKNLSLLATFSNITNRYGQSYQVYYPSITAPTIAGEPEPLFGVPYGPRAVTVTAQVKY